MPDQTVLRATTIDGPALARALDAFVEAYGHSITRSEVLPIDNRPRSAGEFAHRFQDDGWPR